MPSEWLLLHPRSAGDKFDLLKGGKQNYQRPSNVEEDNVRLNETL